MYIRSLHSDKRMCRSDIRVVHNVVFAVALFLPLQSSQAPSQRAPRMRAKWVLVGPCPTPQPVCLIPNLEQRRISMGMLVVLR